MPGLLRRSARRAELPGREVKRLAGVIERRNVLLQNAADDL